MIPYSRGLYIFDRCTVSIKLGNTEKLSSIINEPIELFKEKYIQLYACVLTEYLI